MSMNSVNDRLAEASADAQDTGYILGTVVENEDPAGLGRIKASVPNLFDPAQGELPWIGPHKKSPFGVGSGYGVYGSPAIGSQVRIKFQDGDPHYGLYEADEYSKANANAKFKSPKTWGFKDPSGNELFVNMEDQAWEFTHSSGLSLKYDADGNMKLHVPKDLEETILGNKITNVTGNITENIDGDQTYGVDGDLTETVSGKYSFTVTGNIDIVSQGKITINGTGGVDITSAGVVNISGSAINLN